MIDSEVADENELGNITGDGANEEGQNSSIEEIDPEQNELHSDADYI